MRSLIVTAARPLRKLHRWLGVLLMFPLIIMAVTGILLVHAHWYERPKAFRLPSQPLAPEAAANALIDLLRQASQQKDFQVKQVDVRFQPPRGWVVIVKGVDSQSRQEQEIVQPVNARPGRPSHQETLSLASESHRPQTQGSWFGGDVKKVIKGLHTGEIFGKAWGWLWADVLGIALIFFAISGLIIYLPMLIPCRKVKVGADSSQPSRAGELSSTRERSTEATSCATFPG